MSLKQLDKKSLIEVVLAIMVILVIVLNSKYQLMIVSSGSMEPTISTGSLVIIKKGNNVSKGDIIAFNKGKTIVTHRIKEISDGKIITKGDANNADDPNYLNYQNVIGTYLFAIPMLGYLIYFIKQNFILWILIIITVAILTMMIDNNRTDKEENKNEKVS